MSYLVEFKENESEFITFGSGSTPSDPVPNVLLVEDIIVERRCLARALEARKPGFRVSMADSKLQINSSMQIDVVLIGFDSIEADHRHPREIICFIQSTFPSVPIVVLACNAQDATASADLLNLGVSGCLSYSDGIEGLSKILWLVLHGGACFPRESFLSTPRPAKLPSQDELVEPPSTSPDDTSADIGLTVRERDVVQQLRLGKPNKIIAYELGISISTVKVHVRNIMRKTGTTNRLEAALLSIGSAQSLGERQIHRPPVDRAEPASNSTFSQFQHSVGELCIK